VDTGRCTPLASRSPSLSRGGCSPHFVWMGSAVAKCPLFLLPTPDSCQMFCGRRKAMATALETVSDFCYQPSNLAPVSCGGKVVTLPIRSRILSPYPSKRGSCAPPSNNARKKSLKRYAYRTGVNTSNLDEIADYLFPTSRRSLSALWHLLTHKYDS
jgi:hypothetical protein